MHRMDGGTASSEVEEETDQEDIEAGKRANWKFTTVVFHVPKILNNVSASHTFVHNIDGVCRGRTQVKELAIEWYHLQVKKVG